MRSLPPLLLAAAVAGCGSPSSAPKDMQMSAGADLAAPSLSCSETVDAHCAAGGCVRDLASALEASSWCPDGGTANLGGVTVQHCAGGQTVLVVTYSDSSEHLVYVSGSLAAVLSSLPHSVDLVCVAGPATFAAPSGCDTPTTLCAGP